MGWMRPQAEDTQSKAPIRNENNYNRDMNAPPLQGRQSRPSGGLATLGQSIQIEGTLTGNEDLTINGRVNGEVMLDGHTLTVGPNGKIEAGLTARSVIVQGQVNGSISAKDKIQITSSGTVKGDLIAPRVALDDGAHFAGRVDTGDVESESGSKTSEPAMAAVPARHG